MQVNAHEWHPANAYGCRLAPMVFIGRRLQRVSVNPDRQARGWGPVRWRAVWVGRGKSLAWGAVDPLLAAGYSCRALPGYTFYSFRVTDDNVWDSLLNLKTKPALIPSYASSGRNRIACCAAGIIGARW